MIGLRYFRDPDGLYKLPKTQQLAVLAALRVESAPPPQEHHGGSLPPTRPAHLDCTQDAWDRLRSMEG